MINFRLKVSLVQTTTSRIIFKHEWVKLSHAVITDTGNCVTLIVQTAGGRNGLKCHMLS